MKSNLLPPTSSVGHVTLNCRYTHTSPSIRILRNISHNFGIENAWCQEFSLSEPLWKIAGSILDRNPSIVTFSIYLWNRNTILELAQYLKKLRPDLTIVAGGPEVSFENEAPPAFDYLLCGEAESEWPNFLAAHLTTPLHPQNYDWSSKNAIWPYLPAESDVLSGRIVYLETTRGCPYNCAFCLSGIHDLKVREWMPFDQTTYLMKIRELIKEGVYCFKFLDRTFNYNPARALEWFKALAEVEGATFHFEVCAHLLDDKTMGFLSTLPPGKFQFEIGIQSLNTDSLKSVSSPYRTDVLLRRTEQLIALDKILVHADLLFGLPIETYDSALSGFDRIAKMFPNELQLGFLKFLPGSKLRQIAAEYDYCYQQKPPYEVISNKTLSASDLLQLKEIEYVFNLYYNSNRFRQTLRYLIKRLSLPPSDVFLALARYFRKNELFTLSLSLNLKYQHLLNMLSQAFLTIEKTVLLDYLRLDYVTSQVVTNLPPFLSVPAACNSECFTNTSGSQSVYFEYQLDTDALIFSDRHSPAWYEIRKQKLKRIF